MEELLVSPSNLVIGLYHSTLLEAVDNTYKLPSKLIPLAQDTGLHSLFYPLFQQDLTQLITEQVQELRRLLISKHLILG